MNIDRFAMHVISEGHLLATCTGSIHAMSYFADTVACYATSLEGCTVGELELCTTITQRIDMAVRNSDMNRVVIPTGHKTEVVLTPMLSLGARI